MPFNYVGVQIIFCYFHYQWLMYYFNLTLPIFQMTLLMIILRPISKEYAIISIDFALDIKKFISRNGILKGNLYLSGFENEDVNARNPTKKETFQL